MAHSTHPVHNLLGKLERETYFSNVVRNPIIRRQFERRAHNTFGVIRSIARQICVIPFC